MSKENCKCKKHHWMKYVCLLFEMLFFLIIILLCAGDPDLLDAIIERVRNGNG